MLAVERDALGDVGRLEDLLDRHRRALVDELHHQLVVGDAELAEAPEPRSRVHQEVEEHPALRIEDLAQREVGGVGLVDGLHQLVGDGRERLFAAEVVVDDAGGGHRRGVDDVVLGGIADALGLRRVVVEREEDVGLIGQVGRDVALRERHLAVLDVLGVDELDVVEDVEVLEERRADEPVEVAAGHQAVSLGELRGHRTSRRRVARRT